MCVSLHVCTRVFFSVELFALVNVGVSVCVRENDRQTDCRRDWQIKTS